MNVSGSTLLSINPCMRLRTLVATCGGCSPASFSNVARKFLHLCLAVSGVIWVFMPPAAPPPLAAPPAAPAPPGLAATAPELDAGVAGELRFAIELGVVVVLEGAAAGVTAETAETELLAVAMVAIVGAARTTFTEFVAIFRTI